MSAFGRLSPAASRPFVGGWSLAGGLEPLKVVDLEGLRCSGQHGSNRDRRGAPVGVRRPGLTDCDMRRNFVRKNELKGRFCGDGSRRDPQSIELRNVLE